MVIEPVINVWKARHLSVSGHQGAYAMREIVNAILYQGRTGCQWTYLPHNLPPKSATYYYFAIWRDDGTDQAIHELLRCQVRERARRLEDPTLVVLDTQRAARPTRPLLPHRPGHSPERSRASTARAGSSTSATRQPWTPPGSKPLSPLPLADH